jgi:starvation-inducible DNA-binding protein
MKEINIGLSNTQRESLAQGLAKLLADSYTLYLKTHYFHWNVTGPHFKSLHELFELQYTELALAVDTIAERIRALGHIAPGSYAEFSKLTSIKEETTVPAWNKMVELLVEGHEAVIRTARALLPVVNEADDEVTLGLLAARMDVHEKTAWMLRSMVAA